MNVGKTKFQEINFPKNWRTSDNKIIINDGYNMDNLPNNSFQLLHSFITYDFLSNWIL